MQTSLEKMLANILRREGGFVNDPDDRGGATKYGITQKTLSRFLDRPVSVAEVKNLSQDLAREIYERQYFYAPGIHKLPGAIQAFSFDAAVNHGPRRAIRFVQSVCNEAGFGPLSEDGITGPQTGVAADAAQAKMGDYFLQALVEERRHFYQLIVEHNPSQSKFLNGWLNRVDEFKQEIA